MESPLISLRTPQVLCHTPPFSYSIDSFLKVSQTPNSPTSTKLMESTLILNPSLLFAILSLGLFSHITHIPFFSAFLSSCWRTLAWKIPWTEEPGRLQSMGSRRVGHDWATSLSLFTFMHWRRKWQPTPVFLLGESQGQGSLVGCRLWGRTESDTTEVT